MTQFMEMLKAATAGVHKNLENIAISETIMSPSVDRNSYSEYLQRIYNMHEAVEANAFETIRPVICDVDLRSKAENIRQDLADLGKVPPPINTFLNGHYRPNIHFNLGLMYVAEGSVLGGQYILRNIHKVLGSDIPSRYFKLYGEATGGLWKNFCAQLSGYQSTLSPVETAEIINGAVYGFERAKFSLST